MKRGESGFSMVVGINKDAGHSSHTALRKLKRALGESRVGHAGTLDPFATGVLVALVGPAARLNRYIVADDKSYIADIVFGRSTATDDLEGPTLASFSVGAEAWSPQHARSVLAGFTGDMMQRPPTYSAIKRNGKKACDEARAGRIIEIDPRPVSIARADLIEIAEVSDEGHQRPCWRVAFDVSKGTYIRSLARDIGSALGCGAYLRSLMRTRSGAIDIADCISEESSADEFASNAVDPLRLLGLRAAFADEGQCSLMANGSPINGSDVELLEFNGSVAASSDCCISPWRPSPCPPSDGERIAMLNERGLKAVYIYDQSRGVLASECVFQKEVSRGFNWAL